MDWLYYKISRDFYLLNDRMKLWWLNLFWKQQQDNGYTVIDTDATYYLSYDELWDL